MEEKVNVSGCGLPTILTVIFVIAKLVGVIEWSWWIVFLPIIIPLILWVIIMIVVFLVAIITALFTS